MQRYYGWTERPRAPLLYLYIVLKFFSKQDKWKTVNNLFTKVNKKSYLEIPLLKFFETFIKKTMYKSQFDWGGRLLKSNEGVQR
jgi:hypothetical protein